MNLVKTSNDEWWYVDFRNAAANVREIHPKEKQIDGQTVFEIDDDFLEYRLMIIQEPEAIVQAVCGNLSSMQKEMFEPEDVKDIETQEAVSQTQEFEGVFKTVDFGTLMDDSSASIMRYSEQKNGNRKKRVLNSCTSRLNSGLSFQKVCPLRNSKIFCKTWYEIESLLCRFSSTMNRFLKEWTRKHKNSSNTTAKISHVYSNPIRSSSKKSFTASSSSSR